MAKPSNRLSVALIVGAFFCTGIGCLVEAKSETVPVSGRVTFDGQPVPGAEVSFWSPDHPCGATTAGDGSYKMLVGVYPGTYKVTVNYRFQPNANGLVVETGGSYQIDPESSSSTSIANIPPRYADPKQTELTILIDEIGTEDADFNLTSQ